MPPHDRDMNFTVVPVTRLDKAASTRSANPWTMRIVKAASLATAALLLLSGCGALKRLNDADADGTMMKWDPVNGFQGIINIPPEPTPPPLPPPLVPLPEATANNKQLYDIALEK